MRDREAQRLAIVFDRVAQHHTRDADAAPGQLVAARGKLVDRHEVLGLIGQVRHDQKYHGGQHDDAADDKLGTPAAGGYGRGLKRGVGHVRLLSTQFR